MSLTIKQRIVNMRIAGASYEDIERELNCDMKQISYHLNKDSKVNVSKKMRHGHTSELEAIQAYKVLIGKHPDKKAYFEEKIQEVKDLRGR